MYKSKHRSALLTAKIHTVFQDYLKDRLIGIIMCGGAGKTGLKDYEGSDIDFIVIVSELTPPILESVSVAQSQLQGMYKSRVSQTVLTVRELESIRTKYLTMDGKAVQAVIEAQPEDVAGITMSDIPKLSRSEIKRYSRANLSVLQALLRKTLVRSKAPLTKENKISAAKIALIVQKLYIQSKGHFNSDEIWSGRDKLQDLKLNPEKYTDDVVRQLLLRYLNLGS